MREEERRGWRKKAQSLTVQFDSWALRGYACTGNTAMLSVFCGQVETLTLLLLCHLCIFTCV